MRKVLLVINNDAFGRQMTRWALALKRQGKWEPIIYISNDYMERHVAACRVEDIVVLSPNVLPSRKSTGGDKPVQSKAIISNRREAILRHIHPSLFCFLKACKKNLLSFRVFCPQVFYTIVDLLKQIHFMRYLIQRYQVSAMMISESSPAYGAPIYIKAAHQERVPVVTFPVEKYTKQDFAELYLTSAELSLERPINRLIAAFFPSWVIEHKGHRMLRVVPNLLLALEWLKLRPPHPWQMIDNLEDAIAVDSQISFDHYITEGVHAGQMKIIGNAEHDILYNGQCGAKELKLALFDNLEMPQDRPMLLSSLVQDHYLSARPECDFQDYKSMVEFWVKSLGTIEGYNVVINLHPSHSYDQDSHNWDYIEQWGVKICRQDIATLIPLCDIYIAATSSTIPWAIACGKPVVNYDVYRYGLSTYRNTPGVLEIQEQIDFHNVLKRLTSDLVYYKEIVAHQAACRRHWGLLDGKAVERLENLLGSLIADYTKEKEKRG